MQNSCFFARLFVISGIVVGTVVAPGCKRTPDESSDVQVVPPVVEDVVDIGLPLANSEIGVRLSAAPDNLVPIYNGEYWIELADVARPRLLYTLVSDPQYASGVAVADIDDFPRLVADRDEGRFIERGEVRTALGTARWAYGSYSEDGEVIEQVLLSAPHPSGNGALTVSSICPIGLATVEERIETIQGLLEHVS